MTDADLTPDLCVIGAGSAGLAIAAGAVQMGASVVLIERGEMGGDCLNYGCVPSKALLAAAKQAQVMRDGAKFGVAAVEPDVNFSAVMDHVHSVIATIAPHDSQERFESLGVTVIRAAASFTGPVAVEAGGKTIKARRFVIATGSGPVAPPIPGLADTPFLTNETIFDNRERPSHLIIIGGGPIGMEMAQAHRRLGAKVTVLEASKALSNDDPELTSVALEKLRAEGVDLREGQAIASVSHVDGAFNIHFEDGAQLTSSHLLVAAGRAANLDGLNLEAANVDCDRRGVKVDARLRSTTNRKVFAAGDVAGKYQFTHVAGYHAGVIIQNVLFRLPTKAKHTAVPWVTYTDPEVAQVGLNEVDARKEHGDAVQVLRLSFKDNDRAQSEGRTDGLLKIVTTKSGKVLGAGIVGHNAGEMLAPWAMAVASGDKVKRLAQTILPYPTRSEASKRVAGSFFTPKLYSKNVRWLVRFLAKLR
jgi:pyruvate/2-oxoglutarate dehydrogenase complex dihydrolipoamide dehydrogenase (E3) component